MPSYETLDTIADLYNPCILLAAFVSTIWQWRRHEQKKLRWLTTSFIEVGIYVAVVYGLWFLDKRFGLWPSQGWDYSTHTAFALAMVWPLWLYQVSYWRWVWPISFVFYALLMLYQNYHTIADIASTTAVILLIMAGLQKLFRPRTEYFYRQALANHP